MFLLIKSIVRGSLAAPYYFKVEIMPVKTKNNSFRQLNDEVLKQINGGAANSGSISMTSGAGSLLSMDFEWHQGDMSKSFKIEVGQNIDFNLNAFGNSITNK